MIKQYQWTRILYNTEDIVTKFSITYETIKTASNFDSNITQKLRQWIFLEVILVNRVKIWVLGCVRIWKTLWESRNWILRGIHDKFRFSWIKKTIRETPCRGKNRFRWVERGYLIWTHKVKNSINALKYLTFNTKKNFLKTKQKLMKENPRFRRGSLDGEEAALMESLYDHWFGPLRVPRW
jgi:hypothetical protein